MLFVTPNQQCQSTDSLLLDTYVTAYLLLKYQYCIDISVFGKHHIDIVTKLKLTYRSITKNPFPGLTHSLANTDSCPTPAKSEGMEYLQSWPTEIRYSITWTIFVYL